MRLSRPPEPSERLSLRKQKRLWDEGDALPMPLGCSVCTDLKTCGGLHMKRHAHSCLDHCCGKPETCDGMCPLNQHGFLERMREIDGFSLDNIPAATPQPAALLPAYVPYIYHGNRRAAPLNADVVALPLRMFYRANGMARYANRAAVEERFGLAPKTRIILIGSGRDAAIENWWKLSEARAPLLAKLRRLGVALITGPNYSMFTDEVRYNDMHAMKRIGMAWQEIVAAGVPAAYHLNARTPHDYKRLATFIAARPEVTDVAFELGTGAAWRTRLPFHLFELRQLATRVGRPLHLVMIGGVNAIPKLAQAFERVTYIDTSAFMNAMHRQRLYLNNEGKMKKAGELTLDGQALDGLVDENLATMRSRIDSLLG